MLSLRTSEKIAAYEELVSFKIEILASKSDCSALQIKWFTVSIVDVIPSKYGPNNHNSPLSLEVAGA